MADDAAKRMGSMEDTGAKQAKVKQDPWEHRSKGMVCKTCMWYARKIPAMNLGRCRRHAPTMSGYPVVFADDWCGDHKLSEIAD